MPMVLLSINRERIPEFEELIDEAYEMIQNIDDLSRAIDFSEPNTPKLMVLKNRLKDLQELISNIGHYQDVDAAKKHEKIMDIQNDLLLLTNRIFGFNEEIDMTLSIITNFLLNHLCSTAAATPHSQVIGIANVLAQVLSREHINSEISYEIPKDITQSMYFSRFSLIFNYLITNAGLYAAPIIGLPHISISALGGWAETALEHFSQLFHFIESYFSIEKFIGFDKMFDSIVQFDTTKDVLSSFLYMNEFYASLASLADLLSGLKFPANLAGQENDVVFSSKEHITRTLCSSIKRNYSIILKYIDQIKKMFNEGAINKNENPFTDEDLIRIENEAYLWSLIGEMGEHLIEILNLQAKFYSEENILQNNFYEFIRDNTNDIYNELNILFNKIDQEFSSLMEGSLEDPSIASSSRFVQYRHFFQYMLYVASALWVYFKDSLPINMVNEKYYFLFQIPNIEKNPIGNIILAQLKGFMGIDSNDYSLINQSIIMFNQVLPVVEFQSHHYIHSTITRELFQSIIDNLSNIEIAQRLRATVETFLDGNFIGSDSKLFQKLIVYNGMLEIYEESGVFMVNPGERLIPFDIFTWLLTPGIQYKIPFIPFNTALDNLDEG